MATPTFVTATPPSRLSDTVGTFTSVVACRSVISDLLGIFFFDQNDMGQAITVSLDHFGPKKGHEQITALYLMSYSTFAYTSDIYATYLLNRLERPLNVLDTPSVSMR